MLGSRRGWWWATCCDRFRSWLFLFDPVVHGGGYLYNPDGTAATRPTITTAPGLVHHGQAFDIETSDPSAIDRVVLVRPAAVTHQTDSEQRVVRLTHTTTGTTTLTAQAPDGWHPHALAPQCWYMLFLIDTSGVPSVAHFMHLH